MSVLQLPLAAQVEHEVTHREETSTKTAAVTAIVTARAATASAEQSSPTAARCPAVEVECIVVEHKAS